MKKIKSIHLIVIAIISLLIFLLNPLSMDTKQNALFSSLVFSVALWATEAVPKTMACGFLLLSFALFGNTNMFEIVSFVWSDTMLLIITTTLLSVGIMKTGIVDKYVEKLFRKNSSSIVKLLLLPYVFGVMLVFLIPQAFARVIIIGAILNSLLVYKNEEEKKAKQVLIFNGFIAVMMTYMFFSSGDIVLNQAAIRFAGDEVKEILNFQNWFILMAFPSFIACFASLLLIYILFKKDLSGFNKSMISSRAYENNEISKSKQKITILTMTVIIILWMTQSMHNISSWIPALVGVVILFSINVLKNEDMKSVNINMLIFLMTVFSIGKVLGQSGITNIIFENLKTFIPKADSATYLLIIAAVVMLLHICIGSAVATMSVVTPIMIPLTQSLGYKAEMVSLMIYILVNIHFLLPFHHATVMIGTAKEYYPEKYMLNFGIAMTPIAFILLYFVYFPWWRLMNVL